jgi:hypothetical protein
MENQESRLTARDSKTRIRFKTLTVQSSHLQRPYANSRMPTKLPDIDETSCRGAQFTHLPGTERCDHALAKPLVALPGYLPADCGTYFIKVVCQFSTTVKGTKTLWATGTPIRKRVPSAETSPPMKPGGN